MADKFHPSDRLEGLYVITDELLLPGDQLIRGVQQAIAGGAAIVQYRDKGLDETRRHQQARALARLCRQQDVLFIINDDVALAVEVNANGVHLGQQDAAITQARKLLGHDAIIGISCHNELALAEQAGNNGADYVAFGRFFPSQSKPAAVQADISILRRAKQRLTLPIVAIGGITPDNGASLLAAGADMLAAIHGVFAQDDIQDAARQYVKLFEHTF